MESALWKVLERSDFQRRKKEQKTEHNNDGQKNVAEKKESNTQGSCGSKGRKSAHGAPYTHHAQRREKERLQRPYEMMLEIRISDPDSTSKILKVTP